MQGGPKDSREQRTLTLNEASKSTEEQIRFCNGVHVIVIPTNALCTVLRKRPAAPCHVLSGVSCQTTRIRVLQVTVLQFSDIDKQHRKSPAASRTASL